MVFDIGNLHMKRMHRLIEASKVGKGPGRVRAPAYFQSTG